MCIRDRNIEDSVLAGAGRIGHGIAMRGKPDIQKLVRKAGVGIEMCPISNLQTKAVPGTEAYPLREFLDAGLMVTINTDNRTCLLYTSMLQKMSSVILRLVSRSWKQFSRTLKSL